MSEKTRRGFVSSRIFQSNDDQYHYDREMRGDEDMIASYRIEREQMEAARARAAAEGFE